MEKEQARKWDEAQTITFSVDLVEAAKKHLKFLAAVDRNRFLYEDHVLQRAIRRYNAFWLPLLAKHLENPSSSEAPLVVPLDCEWIWHCHRLNPLRYKADCERLFGRILGSENVISSVQATSKNATIELWNNAYPEEPFELDMKKPFPEEVFKRSSENNKFTSYDLVSAVKRQISFAYQILRPYTSDNLYLQDAVARYKGFLHMTRTNDKNNTRIFCVPTYDIDLIWHTHQLNPVSYCRDLSISLGRVLHHNDNVSDRSAGKLLQTGFSEIIKKWQETLGRSYWKAGTLHRGNPPNPLTRVPFEFENVNVFEGKEFSSLGDSGPRIPFSSMNVVEVLLECIEIKNLEEGNKGNLIVCVSKKQSDKLFDNKRSLKISSESGEKQAVTLKCEPTGEFLFELMSNSPISDELLGSCSFSLEELVASKSQLSADKWLSLEPASGYISSKPILVHVSISFTPPTVLPQVLQLSRAKPFPTVEYAKIPTKVVDQDGNTVFSIQMRNSVEDASNRISDLSKKVYCITNSGEYHALADFVGNHWFIKGSDGALKLQNSSGDDDSIFELVGYKMVKVYPGRRLDFESTYSDKQSVEQGFVTAVEFSTEYPYGKAVALIDFKSETVQATEEWMILPGLTLTFILSDMLKEEIDYKTENGTQGISKTGDISVVKNGALVKWGECSECATVCGYFGKMVKYAEVANCGECGECGDCGASACLHLGVTVKTSGFADCAKCFSCGVFAGDGRETNGDNKGHLGNMVKIDGFADCAKCFSCGVFASDGRAINGDNNIGDDSGMVKNGVVCDHGGARCLWASAMSEPIAC